MFYKLKSLGNFVKTTEKCKCGREFLYIINGKKFDICGACLIDKDTREHLEKLAKEDADLCMAPMYRGMTWKSLNASFNEEENDFFEYMQNYAALHRNNVLIVGSQGTGKTLAVNLVKRDLFLRGRGCTIITEYQMYNNYLAAMKSKDDNEYELFRKYVEEDFMFIDEIGRGFETNASKQYLWQIVDRRIRDNKPTILISNLGTSEDNSVTIDSYLDKDRLKLFKRFDCHWLSYRSCENMMKKN